MYTRAEVEQLVHRYGLEQLRTELSKMPPGADARQEGDKFLRELDEKEARRALDLRTVIAAENAAAHAESSAKSAKLAIFISLAALFVAAWPLFDLLRRVI